MSLQRGIELFNAGRYWEAHEAWEEVWMPDRHGPDAGFYKGLIQLAAGCLHHGRSNRRGTVNKWSGGLAYLRPYLPRHLGVELAPLLASIEVGLTTVASTTDGWPSLEPPLIATQSGGREGQGRPPAPKG